MTTLGTLHEHLGRFAAQGLRHLDAAELDTPIQEFAALNLTPPAALLTGLQQHVAARAVTAADSDAFIKVVHTLNQATVQLSAADRVDTQALRPLAQWSSMYVQPDQLVAAETPDHHDRHALFAILALPNRFVGASRLRTFLQQATLDELRQTIDIAWCDALLSQTIASALQARPDEALALARIALEHDNLVIQWTGIRVAVAVSALPSHQPAALGLLQDCLDNPRNSAQRWDEALRAIFQEAVARAGNQYADYQRETQRLYESCQHYIQQLRSSKTREQLAGIRGLAQSEHPYFAPILAEALTSADPKIVANALDALYKIQGFTAIPDIMRLLDGPHAKAAVETLARFGDRSALEYIFTHIEPKPIPAHFRNALQRFGPLIIPPLCAALKRMAHPKAYKPALSSIFTIARSDDVVQALTADADQDPAYAQKLVELLQALYPKQIKAPQKKTAPPLDFATIKPWLPMLLGGRTLSVREPSIIRSTLDSRRLVVLPAVHAEQSAATIITTDTWQPEARLPTPRYPTLMAVLPDGRHVVIVGCAEREPTSFQIDIWNMVAKPALVRSFSHPEPVFSLSLSADGQRLFIGGKGHLNVVEFTTGKLITTLKGHHDDITFLTAMPEQHCVLSGDMQGCLRVWDDTTLQPVAIIKSHNWWHPHFAALSADRRMLVYAHRGSVHSWETQGWREIFAQPDPFDSDCMALLPDGRHLALGIQKKLRIVERDTLKDIFVFESDAPITAIEVTADGRHLVTFGRSDELKVWHVDVSLIM